MNLDNAVVLWKIIYYERWLTDKNSDLSNVATGNP